MFFYIAIVAWLGGVVVSYYNGNRKLPTVVLLLGLALLIGTRWLHVGAFGIAGVSLLAAIIWIANKADML